MSTEAVVAGPDAGRLMGALDAAGVDAVDEDAPLVWVQFTGTELDGLEDALTAWWQAARTAAEAGTDLVTVVADRLVDGEDVAGAALAHGLVAATRAWAMERDFKDGVGNIVVAGDALEGAAHTVRHLVEHRAVSGDVLTTGTPRHGRQRL